MYDYRNNESCYKYQSFFRELEEIVGLVSKLKNNDFTSDGQVLLAIELKETGEMIGEVDILVLSSMMLIGYTISYKYQRQGYCYETIKNLVKFLQEKIIDCKIYSLVNPNNFASIKLLEKIGCSFIEYSKEFYANVYEVNIIE